MTAASFSSLQLVWMSPDQTLLQRMAWQYGNKGTQYSEMEKQHGGYCQKHINLHFIYPVLLNL